MITFERFEAAKIKRFIQRYGSTYHFKRSDLNAFEEPTGILFDVCTVKGVYHEAKYSHLDVTESGGGSFITGAAEIEPMILCLKDDISSMISEGDVVEINGKTNVVERIKDINNSGFAYDISLRLIDNGSKA